MDPKFTSKTYVDFLSEFSAGINSGVAPELLQKNQLSFGMNLSLRGGFAHARPPVQKKTLNYNGNTALQTIVETGLFQGGGYYRPDYGTESLIAQINGHLIQFTESGSSWMVTDISIPGDFNNPTISQVWMWQSEKWMIVQDGSGTLPIFYDGTTSRRSYGPSVLLGTAVAFDPSTPPPIGGIETVTLAAPYTGPFNVPVIFNGEFYQPTQSNSIDGYAQILSNLFATVGAVIPSGSNLVVQPASVGKIIFASAITISGAFHQTDIGVEVGSSDIFIGDRLVIKNIEWDVIQIYSTFDNGVVKIRPTQRYIQIQKPFAPLTPQQVPNVSNIVTNANITAPNVVIGATTADFTNPSPNETAIASLTPGGQVTISISIPYVGQEGQTVWIGTEQYAIYQAPLPPITSTLLLINLTDVSVGAYVNPEPIMSVPEIPAGRMGAYGMGCNACSLTDGISFIIGDVVGSGAGTQANNYRDAILKTVTNDFIAGGGSFRLPGTGDIITAMIFPPNLDTSLGQGPLQIGTAFSIFSNNVPGTDPATWAATTNPIQTESLKDKGPLGQNSTISVNSDTFFRSFEGIGSLVLARRDFDQWGNKSISNEMQRVLDADNQALLSYGSSITCDNRFLSTAIPNVSGRGVFHIAVASLNLDLISSLRTTLPPCWEGAWTGVNVLQMITGRVNGSKRDFAFTFNIDQNAIELYEFLPEKTSEHMDNGVTPILYLFETPVIFNKYIKPPTELTQLRDGEVYLSNIKGNVSVDVYYRPDYYPCWTLWRHFDVCQSNDADNSKAGYRTRIGLGEPSVEDCEPGNNRPLRTGYFFQCRVVITGSCTWKGMKASAITVPQATFATVECDPRECQVIDCDIPDDFRLYTLQGLPPVTPTPPRPPVENFSNEQVSLIVCELPSTPQYSEVLPTWITIDGESLIGAANTFRGVTQAAANATALSVLTDFANQAKADSRLTCSSGFDWSEIVWGVPDLQQIGIGLPPTFSPISTTGDSFSAFDGLASGTSDPNPNFSSVELADLPLLKAGVVDYNGTGFNAKLNFTASSTGGIPVSDNQQVSVYLFDSGVYVQDILVFNARDYDGITAEIPFTVPDTMGGTKQIVVEIVAEMSKDGFDSGAYSFNMSGTFENA